VFLAAECDGAQGAFGRIIVYLVEVSVIAITHQRRPACECVGDLSRREAEQIREGFALLRSGPRGADCLAVAEWEGVVSHSHDRRLNALSNRLPIGVAISPPFNRLRPLG